MGSGIAFGLAAALCWGVADFCARGASRAAGTFLTLLYIEIIASVALFALALPLGLLHFSTATFGAVLAAVLLNVAILGGAALLYRAFAIGTLALVSPIASSFAAITALLAILTGERPALLQLAGIVLALGGVVLASTVPGQPSAEAPKSQPVRVGPLRLAPGLIEAIVSMLIFGVTYWALRYIVDALGSVTFVFIGKLSDLVTLVLIGLVVLGTRFTGPVARSLQLTRLPTRSFLVFVVPTAVLDTAANVAYALGITTALTSVVSVLSSLFSAVTVLLAWLFLSERLSRLQWLGVLAILAGIALVSL